LLDGAGSGEHGELLAHVLGTAIRAVGIVTVPDELLEMRLALHAHILVDRHRRESLGSCPDEPQIDEAKGVRRIDGDQRPSE